MSENPSNPAVSRHIDTRMYFLLQLVRCHVLKLSKVQSCDNVANAFTKSLPVQAFQKHQCFLFGCTIPFDPIDIPTRPACATGG
eukprot:2422962-Rhodomonas_salina.1